VGSPHLRLNRWTFGMGRSTGEVEAAKHENAGKSLEFIIPFIRLNLLLYIDKVFKW